MNAGTSDFLGVYTAIAPARIVEPDGCVTALLPGTWASPAMVAEYFSKQASLEASRPVPVSIGRLRGVAVDLRTKRGATQPTCTVNGQRIQIAGLFTGLSPSSLDHAVIRGMTMRLLLLSSAGKVLAVEIDDIDAAPGSLADLTAVARNLQFA